MTASDVSIETKSPPSNIEKRVRIACFFALLALGLIVLSLLVPTPLPVIVAMSVAQAIGTLSLLLFLRVVSRDVWRFLGGKSQSSKKDLPDEPSPTN